MDANVAKCEDKDSIYLVISDTGTIISRLLRIFSHNNYNHISLSLNEELTEMYSFARRISIIFTPGGYVKEDIRGRIFNRPRVNVVILKLRVDKRKYAELVDYIHMMYAHRFRYGYDYIGVFFILFGKRVTLFNRQYCSSFVQYILGKYRLADIDMSHAVRPCDFIGLPGAEQVYIGRLKDYMEVKHK